MPDNQIKSTNPEIVLYQTPSMLMQLAVQKDFDIDRLRALMELQERWEKNEAKKAYVVAMTEFKKSPPQIIKDMHVEFNAGGKKVEYNHASLGNLVSTITEGLSKVNLSANWETEQSNNAVKVTCKLTHIAGHTESISITAPPDTSGSKNTIQAIGSTITYLQRYTLLAICGLATNEFEDDGRQGNTGNGKTQTTNSEALNQAKSSALDIVEKLKESNKITEKKYNEWKSWIEKASSIKTIQDQIDAVLKPKLEKEVANA